MYIAFVVPMDESTVWPETVRGMRLGNLCIFVYVYLSICSYQIIYTCIYVYMFIYILYMDICINVWLEAVRGMRLGTG
jgi:hypothetical protein